MILDLPKLNAFGLVDINFVRVCRRLNTDEVLNLCDTGALTWVFNVSVRGRANIRELRFFLSEIVTPQMAVRLSLDEVIEKIFPSSRSFFWSREVGSLLLLSRVTVAVLARKLGAVLKNRTFQFSRSSLVAWLRARWIGGAT